MVTGLMVSWFPKHQGTLNAQIKLFRSTDSTQIDNSKKYIIVLHRMKYIFSRKLIPKRLLTGWATYQMRERQRPQGAFLNGSSGTASVMAMNINCCKHK
jgi:hypothetical protein